jgi:hypothetical protein
MPAVRKDCTKKKPGSQNACGGPLAAHAENMAVRARKSARYEASGLSDGYDVRFHRSGSCAQVA